MCIDQKTVAGPESIREISFWICQKAGCFIVLFEFQFETLEAVGCQPEENWISVLAEKKKVLAYSSWGALQAIKQKVPKQFMTGEWSQHLYLFFALQFTPAQAIKTDPTEWRALACGVYSL